MSDAVKLFVAQDSIRAASEEVDIPAKGTKRGELCVIDWQTEMALEGRVYQVRYGLQAAPMTGDQPIATTKAESCLDPDTGVVNIPIYLICGFVTAAGTVTEIRAGVVATASTAGAAYVPLNIFLGGNSCRSTARCAQTGGVTVTAEAEATALLCYDHVAPIAVAANATPRLGGEWQPSAPPVLPAGYCFYVQVGGTTTSPTYHLSYNFIELPLVNVS